MIVRVGVLGGTGPAGSSAVITPVLRIPDGEKPWLQPQWLTLLVDALETGQVIDGELHVVQLLAKVGTVVTVRGVTVPGLVVDNLARALAGVVDAVDLSVDLRHS